MNYTEKSNGRIFHSQEKQDYDLESTRYTKEKTWMSGIVVKNP